MAASGVGASASCTTPTTGDEVNEGAVGAGYENSWTEGQGDADPDTTPLLAGAPEGSCDEGITFDANAAHCSSYWDKGSIHDISEGPLVIVMEVYFTNLTASDAYDNFKIAHWDDDTTEGDGGNTIRLRRDDAGNYQLYAYGDASTSSFVTIVVNTWYTLTFYLADSDTPGNSYLQVVGGGSETCDAASECTFTEITTDCRYFRLGPSDDIGAGDRITMVVGYVYINSP